MATTFKEALNGPLLIILVILFLISTIFLLYSSPSAYLPSLLPTGGVMIFLLWFGYFWDQKPFLLGPWVLPWWAVRSLRKLQLPCETGLPRLKNDFCTNCEDILLGSPLLNGTKTNFGITRSTEWHPFHIQANHDANADTGPNPTCPLCTVLYDNAKLGSTKSKTSPSSDQLQLKIWQPVEEEGCTFLQLHSSGRSISAAFRIHEGRYFHRKTVKSRMVSTLSEVSMEQVKSWISRCLDNHDKCRRNYRFLPRRLIHLSSDGKIAKLLPTANTIGCEKSTVASHAWGDGVPFQLTSDKYEDLVKGFNVSELPATFAELFSIALNLGIPYVWIDSLCIIQDSNEDKQTELVTMAKIYESAEITIAATASKDSTEGCMRLRDEYLYSECVLLISTPDRYYDPQCLYIIPEMLERRKDMEFNFFTKVDTAPLNQRAWVFQEKILSPRILHCAEGMLLFECNTMRATEIYPPGVEYDKEESVHRSTMYTYLDTHTHESPGSMWNSAVTAFVTDIESRSVDCGVPKHQVDWVASSIDAMALTGISGSQDEIDKLNRIIKRLPTSIQSRVRRGWKALAYHYSSLTKDEVKEDQFLITTSTVGSRGALENLYSINGKSQALTEPEKLEYHRRAYELVTEFSRRGITKRSDRLRAFSGLTQRISDRAGIECCAGLWRPMLHYDLLWMRSPKSKLVRRPKEPSFAPSWSWACSAGKVVSALVWTDIATRKPQDPSKLPRIHINIKKVTLMRDDQGVCSHELMIDGGQIKLRGQVKRVSLKQFPCFLDFALDEGTEQYFCLLVFSETKRGSKEGTWIGLLLQRTSDTPEKCYKRCGIVIVDGKCEWGPGRKWKTKVITLI